ncbi:conserved hypothetical protein [Altererythrobacter sp. B11]|uniref:hypothetical protein n=1 Tax=Altererythrobacter sp. B11 TaxID=2060312 RepID=UPI000DC727D2|nr:hypothetical protein [Altererythrobacter sp. B11]BBC72928.1 conserved hypothetical protein [Altererythrobacter sp. B11]
MPQGFQAWDAAGNLMVDLGSRAGRALGSATLNTGSGSFSHPGFAQGTPFWIIGAEAGTISASNPWAFTPQISVNGTTLSWNFIDQYGNLVAPTTTYLIYGVY